MKFEWIKLKFVLSNTPSDSPDEGSGVNAWFDEGKGNEDREAKFERIYTFGNKCICSDIVYNV